ncbi:MAG TPA: hypothetical protein VEX69_03525 [Candidatus Limnocylindria bacterium]|nr:hypothetical protein [Candidatus Limnocylindria bacterium]
MHAVLQATHAFAFGLSGRRGPNQQRQRRGEQRDDYNDGLSASHRD